MPLEPGTTVFLQYPEEDLYHERIVCRHVRGSRYVTLTPDYDLGVEELRAPPLGDVRKATGREIPTGIDAASCYRFPQVPRPA
eukprot:402276-Lingulodinium_polyedra.AAC.1